MGRGFDPRPGYQKIISRPLRSALFFGIPGSALSMGCLAGSFGISRHSRLQIYVVSADVVGGATVTDKTDLTDNNGQWGVTRLQTNACSLPPAPSAAKARLSQRHVCRRPAKRRHAYRSGTFAARRPIGDGVSVLSVKSVMSVLSVKAHAKSSASEPTKTAAFAAGRKRATLYRSGTFAAVFKIFE